MKKNKRPYSKTESINNVNISIVSAYQDNYLILSEQKDSKVIDHVLVDISEKENRDKIRALLDFVENIE